MKMFVMFASFTLFAFAVAKAQDSWKVVLNNKIILQSKGEQQNTSIHLKAPSYKGFDKFTITYTTANADAAWNRMFYINDENDSTILTLNMNKQSGSVSVKSNMVRDIISNKKSMSIYTLSKPKDRALAARVRVARVLLGKIEWN